MSAFPKHPFQAGREQVRKLNEDRARFDFIDRLFNALKDYKLTCTDIEGDFIQRIICETNPDVPQIHPGDANIIDSLRRKYQARLDAMGGKS